MDERKRDTARIPDAQTPRRRPETPNGSPWSRRRRCGRPAYTPCSMWRLRRPGWRTGPGGVAVPGDPELEGGV